MPCRSDYMEPTPNERHAAATINSNFQRLADRLTHANDVLRERLLGTEVDVLKFINLAAKETFDKLSEKGESLYVRPSAGTIKHTAALVKEYLELNDLVVNNKKLTAAKRAKIEKAQIAHREADLRRLLKTFSETFDRENIRKVLDADATKPLEPQLGFDPDKY